MTRNLLKRLKFLQRGDLGSYPHLSFKIIGWFMGLLLVFGTFYIVLSLLLESIKYVLFTLGLCLTGLLVLMIYKPGIRIRIPLTPSSVIVDYFFIASSVIVLGLNTLDVTSNFAIFILSVTTTFFLPGWVLLRLLGTNGRWRTNLASLVLSFALSIGLTSLLYTSSLVFVEFSISLELSAIYAIVSFLPLIKRWSHRHEKQELQMRSDNSVEKNYNLSDVLLLTWISIFFTVIILYVYPALAYWPSNDIVSLFSSTRSAILSPELFRSVYPWFHFTWAATMELSQPPMWLFQSGLAFLSIMVIFSFFLMAKSYLRSINKHAPILATIFFSIFSGLGWIYLAYSEIVLNTPDPHFDNLVLSSLLSLSDLGSGQGIWLWLSFRPLTVGFSIFFILVYLMRREDFPRQSFTVVSSLLVLTLSKIHLPELVMFVTFLFFLSLFYPKNKLRIRDIAISTLIGLSISGALGQVYNNGLGFDNLSTPYSHLLILAIMVVVSIIFEKYPRRPKLSFNFDMKLMIMALLFVYTFLLFHWFMTADLSEALEIRRSGILPVPWEFYPVQLGVTGVLGILGIAVLWQKYRNYPVKIFALLLLLSIVFGRVLTFVNANFVDTSYWERRIIPLVHVSMSMLAPLAVFAITEKLLQWKQKETDSRNKISVNLKNVLTVAFLTVLVIGGILSTFLTIEYRLIAASTLKLQEGEADLINSLNNTHHYSTLLTFTDRSKYVAEFASLAYIINRLKDQIWSAENPELPLHAITVVNGSSIIFASSDDLERIAGQFGGGYAAHLLKSPAIKVGENGSRIIQLPKLVPVSPNSDTILVIPEHLDRRDFYAYDILSRGGFNYTTAVQSDIASIARARTVIVQDEYTAASVMQSKQKYGLQFEKLIVLNLHNIYGHLTDFSNLSVQTSTVVGDNSSSGWTATFGTKVIPKLNVTDNTSIKGHDSINEPLEIDLPLGNNIMWEISKSYPMPLNLSRFDFAYFNWYGRGDGEYVVEFSSGPFSILSYRFQDSWRGWNTVVLPINRSIEQDMLSGVMLDKLPAEPDAMNTVNKISLRPTSPSSNQSEFYVDKFSFGNLLQSSSVLGTSDSKKNITFPKTVSLYPIVPKLEYNSTFDYDSGVPFIFSQDNGSYELVYINLGPIIDDINPTNSVEKAFPLLSSLLESQQPKLRAYESSKNDPFSIVEGGVAAFDRSTFIGNLSLDSSSAIINVDNSAVELSTDGQSSLMENVSRILPIYANNVIVKSNGGIINGGSGFYSQVVANHSLVRFNGDPAILELMLKDGSIRKITGNDILANVTKPDMLIREPRVESDGVVIFNQFESYGELDDNLRASGQGVLKLNGSVKFTLEYADKYSLIKDASLEGEITRSQPFYTHDEVRLLQENILSAPYIQFLLTQLAFFVAIYFLVISKNTKSIKNTATNV